MSMKFIAPCSVIRYITVNENNAAKISEKKYSTLYDHVKLNAYNLLYRYVEIINKTLNKFI